MHPSPNNLRKTIVCPLTTTVFNGKPAPYKGLWWSGAALRSKGAPKDILINWYKLVKAPALGRRLLEWDLLIDKNQKIAV